MEISRENVPSKEQIADLETVYASAGYMAITGAAGAADRADHAGSSEFGVVEDLELQ